MLRKSFLNGIKSNFIKYFENFFEKSYKYGEKTLFREDAVYSLYCISFLVFRK